MLEAFLSGKGSDDTLDPDPIDDYRDAMLQMQERWTVIRRQLNCASEQYACEVCPSGRVVDCIVENCDPELLESRGIVIGKGKPVKGAKRK